MTQIDEIQAIQAKNSLTFIKEFLDAIEKGTTIVTLNSVDNTDTHSYTLQSVFHMIKGSAYVGLGLGVPKS